MGQSPSHWHHCSTSDISATLAISLSLLPSLSSTSLTSSWSVGSRFSVFVSLLRHSSFVFVRIVDHILREFIWQVFLTYNCYEDIRWQTVQRKHAPVCAGVIDWSKFSSSRNFLSHRQYSKDFSYWCVMRWFCFFAHCFLYLFATYQRNTAVMSVPVTRRLTSYNLIFTFINVHCQPCLSLMTELTSLVTTLWASQI